MARIRTIKPSFFRHEGLQELELKHKGKYPMFVFAGLWGHCDKLGRFQWRPRLLKLDILPFLPFEMSDTLDILEQHGYLKRYTVNGEVYGFVPTFTEHQRIGGKEAQGDPEYPDPIENPTEYTSEATGKHQGSTGEAMGIAGREGKGIGREQEGKGTANASHSLPAPPSLRVGEVVEIWNAFPGLVRAKSITGPIRKRIETRIREGHTDSWFAALFYRVSQSDFLSGRKTDFAATLDWVLGPKNLAKIEAGNFDNREVPPPTPPSQPPQQKCVWSNGGPCESYAIPTSRYCAEHKAKLTEIQNRKYDTKASAPIVPGGIDLSKIGKDMPS